MASNPFSTKFIQPGAIPFEFVDTTDAFQLAKRFLESPYGRMCVVGPHGSGKSSLVAILKPILQHNSPQRSLLHFRLTAGVPSSRPSLRQLFSLPSHAIILLDGYEQLPILSRCVLHCKNRFSGVALLVTSHKKLWGFKNLWQTTINDRVERYVLEQLLLDYPPDFVELALSSEEWKQSRSRRGANLRETLFDMYDWWEIQGP